MTEKKPRVTEGAGADSAARTDWLTRFSYLMGRLVPDAITASIILMVILFGAALAMGNSVTDTLDAYYRGLWMLLPFTMQMTLILVLSAVLGSTPLFRSLVVSLSNRPRTANQVFIMSALLSAAVSYCYWGLGLALSPLIAIHFARQAESRGIAVDFPFLMSVTGVATSVWQYGLSASAPLLMATPGHFLQETTGIMELRTTIWSLPSILVVTGFTAGVLILACSLKPANPQPLSLFPDAHKLVEPAIPRQERDLPSARGPVSAERLEHNALVSGLLSLALAGWLVYHFIVRQASLDLNSLNTSLLFLCFLLHRNIHNFTKALQEAVLCGWPVLVIYHLYAGVAGLIQFTPVGESFASFFASISTRYTFPLLTAIAGTAIAVFVPSSGGQWVIQGFVTIRAAEAVGVTAQRGMLALGIGDQMGNLISPFWIVVRAGIARIDFRVFFGYGLIFAALWFIYGVLVFTFMP